MRPMKIVLWVLCVAVAGGCSRPAAEPAPPAPAPAPASAPAPAPAAPKESVRPPAKDHLSYTTPAEWVSEKPANEMRKAQYRVPDRKGKSDPASLTLFTFGGPAASLESNVERWREQMGGGDASISKVEGAASPATVVDITGTYAGDDKGKPVENARLLAAVVEAGDRTWYFKMVGPADTVDGWKDAFITMLKGVRPIE
jgi:hypothetical protein